MPLQTLVVGEALVDEFHDTSVAGGAPFNVARSLAALGAPVQFVSRIGADANGDRLRHSAAAFGLRTSGLQTDPARATGRVSVHEGEGGGHCFEIHADAAWDHLEAPASTDADVLYFGSLAQRAPASRAVIRQLAKRFTGLRLLDLNLRPGTDSPLFAAESLMLADWVKLNDEELDRLLTAFDCADVAALVARFALQRLALTRGADGWSLFGAGGELLAAGPGEAHVTVVDTVGAGDSFTAMLLAGLALGRDLPATLQLANRYAAMICGVRGPLPAPEAIAPWRAALHALEAT